MYTGPVSLRGPALYKVVGIYFTKRLQETSMAPAYHPADGGLMLMYSRQTSVSTQPAGRRTTVFSGDIIIDTVTFHWGHATEEAALLLGNTSARFTNVGRVRYKCGND